MKKDSSRTTRALIVENSDFKKKTHKTGQSLSDQNMMNHNQTQQDYEATFREMLEGFALHEVICNVTVLPTHLYVCRRSGYEFRQ